MLLINKIPFYDFFALIPVKRGSKCVIILYRPCCDELRQIKASQVRVAPAFISERVANQSQERVAPAFISERVPNQSQMRVAPAFMGERVANQSQERVAPAFISERVANQFQERVAPAFAGERVANQSQWWVSLPHLRCTFGGFRGAHMKYVVRCMTRLAARMPMAFLN